MFDIFKSADSEKSKLNLLTIDGGGMRGVACLCMLERLCEKTHKKVPELFDVVAGTSTGAIVTTGLMLGEKGEPLYTPTEMIDFYFKTAQEIFKTSFIQNVRTGGGLWAARYQKEGMHKIIKEYIKDKKLSDFLKPVIITSYSLKEKRISLWKSSEANKNPKKDFSMTDIVMSAAAAPVFFEPHRFEKEGKEYLEADGALYANNPGAIGVSYAYELFPEFKVGDHVILSLGSGRKPLMPFSEKSPEKKTLGMYEWLIDKNVFELMAYGDSEETNLMLNTISKAFYRFEVPMNQDVRLDESSLSILEEYVESTRKYLDENEALFDKACAHLLEN